MVVVGESAATAVVVGESGAAERLLLSHTLRRETYIKCVAVRLPPVVVVRESDATAVVVVGESDATAVVVVGELDATAVLVVVGESDATAVLE